MENVNAHNPQVEDNKQTTLYYLQYILFGGFYEQSTTQCQQIRK